MDPEIQKKYEIEKFKLPRGLNIYAGLVLALCLVLKGASSFNRGVPAAGIIGQSLAAVVICYYLPMFFSWCAWFTRGKSKIARTVTFLLFFHFFLLSQVNPLLEEVQKRESYNDEFKNIRKEMLEASLEDDVNKRAKAAEKVTTQLRENLTKQAELSTGIEKQFYEINEEVFKTVQRRQQVWLKSSAEFDACDLLNFKELRDAEGQKLRLAVLKRYHEAAKVYLAGVEGHLDFYIKALEPIKSSRFAKEAIEGARESYGSSSKIVIPLQKESVAYSQKLRDLISFLSKTDNWQYNEELQQAEFFEDGPLNRYNEILADVIKHENEINRLNEIFVASLKKK